MGRMKEICIQIMQENDGIPEGMTISDALRMRELEIYNWEEYEREQEKARIQQHKSKDSREIAKTKQANKKFSPEHGKTGEKKENK